MFVFITFLSALLAGGYHYELYTWNSKQENILIKNGTLFDAKSGDTRANPGILITSGIIQCIGAQCEVPVGVKTIDATGKSIMPGLIDLHGHFFSSSSTHSHFIKMLWEQIRFLPKARAELIESGITSYRSLGDISPQIFDLKHALKSNRLAGPRLFISGPIFTVSGGHPTQRKDISPWVMKNMTFQSDDPEQVIAKVLQLAQLGTDGIKVVYQGYADHEGDVAMPRMSLDTLKAISQTARDNGMWVAVHSGSASETLEAVDVGISTIEHGIRHGNLINNTLLERVVDKNVVYVPTLGREPQGHLNISRLISANVLIGVGTDSPVRENGKSSYYQELKRLVDAGMSAKEVILAATKNGAQALKMSDKLGTIESGKYADLLIVDGEPWNNITDIEHVTTVIIDGRIAHSQ